MKEKRDNAKCNFNHQVLMKVSSEQWSSKRARYAGSLAVTGSIRPMIQPNSFNNFSPAATWLT